MMGAGQVAYGKGQPKGTEKRMAELGRVSTSADLGRLRLLVLEACDRMADEVWPASITADIPPGKDLDAVMLATQAGLKGTLNSVWAEKARLIAKSAVQKQWKRARNNIFGRLRHIATVGDKPMPGGCRRLVNLPEEWSSRLTEAEIAHLQTFADSLDFPGAMAMFRKLAVGHVPCGLTTAQCEALAAMLGATQERYGKPTWQADEAVVQLHLDYRCLVGVRPALDSLLGRLKHEVNRLQGRPSDAAVDQELVGADDGRLVGLHRRFFKLLGVVGRLKLLRRQVYRVIDGLKRSWFGFVTTKLAQLCREHKAAYVRENLTILAEGKESPGNKGRTFNKVLNNGSKGQFLRRMSAKLKWYGIPEVVVPSFFTSSTDVRHSCVDGGQRRGEMFTARADGRKMHADVHAALTLALWPILRPRPALVIAA